MAKDSSKGLYLPLKIDLSEWEQSLAAADADLQKAMREMKASVKDLSLRYDVEIAGAKAAGNDLKALELQERKLNQLYDTQRQVVQALNNAYEKSVKEKGASAEASQKLAQALVRESKQMDRIKAQIDARGLNIGKALSDGMATVSPEFARIRQGIASLTSSMSTLGTTATSVAKTIGTIGIPVAVVGATVGGIKKLVDSYKETAQASAEANEEIYQLREVLNSSYKEAELLAGAARIDGVNLNALGASVNMLYKNIDAGNEKGKRAVAVLEQYGATITDISGNRKNTIEFFRELQNAFANAESMGKGRDFLTALFGGSSDQFLHFIKGFDYYISKAEEVQSVNEREYQLSHDLLDLKKQQAEAERVLAAAKGDAFVNGAVEAQKAYNAGIKEQVELYDNAKNSLKGYSDEMKNLALAEAGAGLAWEKFKISLKLEGMQLFDSAWQKLKKLSEVYKSFKDTNLGKVFDFTTIAMPGMKVVDGIMNAINKMKEAEDEVAERMADDENNAEIAGMQARIDEEKRIAEQKERNEAVLAKKQQEENQKVLDKQKEAQEKFYRELRDLRASDYEREIYQLEDRKQAWIDSGIAIVDAEKRFSEEKAIIDKKYYDKQQAEREKSVKQQQEAYNKEIEMAKKAKEARISEAEGTLKSNLKLLRYIKKQQENGTYNEADAKAYADKLHMRQAGYRQTDIDFLKQYGVDRLKDVANARDRLFSGFAQPVSNSVTINFDNTVVEEVNAMDRLANKVAEVITPAIQQALRGGTSYGY